MRTVRLLLVGIVGGLLSGLFGVGGGIVMVPLLIWLVGFDQRRASATSLIAIVPAAVAGMATYWNGNQVNLVAGALIALGGIVGAQIGAKLLAHLPITYLRWGFIALMVLVAIRTAFDHPSRGATFDITPLGAFGLVALGVFMGIAAGLFGVGGGTIAVPGMVLGFGVGDLLAKGTSLLAMIPTAISGSTANIRRGLANINDGLIVGIAAALASYGGVRLAFLLSPRVASVLFAVLMVVAAAQLAMKARKQ